jgi:hypothetical protein
MQGQPEKTGPDNAASPTDGFPDLSMRHPSILLFAESEESAAVF